MTEALDQFYGTPGLLLAMWEMALGDPAQFKEKYRRYIALGAEAACLWHFGVSVLPGLLQTDAYASEVLALGGYKGKELEEQVALQVLPSSAGMHGLVGTDVMFMRLANGVTVAYAENGG